MGGYKLIDLHDVSIPVNGASVTISGAHEAIEHNYRKATMLTNLVINDVEASDRWANFRPTSNGFIALIGFNDEYLHLMLQVTQDDEVSIFEQ